MNDRLLLEALVDSWNRNNRILVNLLRALPPEALDVRTRDDGPSVAGLFAHVHYVRLVFVDEDAPEFARGVPEHEWVPQWNRDGLATQLDESAKAVMEAVRGRIEAGKGMDLHYDHPILMLQHMIWHEGYHHGQIKLALGLAGMPLPDDEVGPLTWGVWMRKTARPAP